MTDRLTCEFVIGPGQHRRECGVPAVARIDIGDCDAPLCDHHAQYMQQIGCHVDPLSASSPTGDGQ